MKPRQYKALQALLTCPTKAAAAEAAGISPRTMRDYLADPEFQAEYQRAFSDLVKDATAQAKQNLSSALSVLRSIAEDDEENASSRVAAARSLLEYGVKLTELNDVIARVEALEDAHRG